MYRSARAPLATVLADALAPHGFVPLDAPPELRAVGIERGYSRRTWNTNRGVVLASPREVDIASYTQTMRTLAARLLSQTVRQGPGGFWSRLTARLASANQLGLQIVYAVEGPLPDRALLDALVDKIDTGGTLVQSVFAVSASRNALVSARTWGQVFTGRFQDAIEVAIREFARSSPEV